MRRVSPPSVSFNRVVARNSIHLLSVVSSLLCLYGEPQSSLLSLLWKTSVVRWARLTRLCIEVWIHVLSTDTLWNSPGFVSQEADASRLPLEQPITPSIDPSVAFLVRTSFFNLSGVTDNITQAHILLQIATEVGRPPLPIRNINSIHSTQQPLETHWNNHQHHQQHDKKIWHEKNGNRHFLQTTNTTIFLPSNDHTSTNHTTTNDINTHPHIPTNPNKPTKSGEVVGMHQLLWYRVGGQRACRAKTTTFRIRLYYPNPQKRHQVLMHNERST